jgi:hypothetical protein
MIGSLVVLLAHHFVWVEQAPFSQFADMYTLHCKPLDCSAAHAPCGVRDELVSAVMFTAASFAAKLYVELD